MNEPPHVVRVLGGPLRGTHSTHTLSGQHFGRHWHDAYGFGILETGAQRSASGRGRVDAFAGQVITTNPGEVHDGSPLGSLTRRWQILSVDTDVFSSLIEHSGAPAEITRPVIDDPSLFDGLRRLFRRLERWHACNGNRATEALACEEALVEAAVGLVTRHGTVRLRTDAPNHDLRRIRDRLADELAAPPFSRRNGGGDRTQSLSAPAPVREDLRVATSRVAPFPPSRVRAASDSPRRDTGRRRHRERIFRSEPHDSRIRPSPWIHARSLAQGGGAAIAYKTASAAES